MAKRSLPEDYRAGIAAAIDLLKGWRQQENVNPWGMADRYASMVGEMSEQASREFQDTVFLYLQWVLDETPPDLDSSGWLRDLEDPDRWREDGDG